MKNEERDIVVYGSIGDYVYFLKKNVAEYYAKIWSVMKGGITFGELHKRYSWLLDDIIKFMGYDLPDADEYLCDEYFDLLLETSEDLPTKSDIFDESNLHEILNYEPSMTWLPEKIVKRFAKEITDRWGSDFLDLNPLDTDEIVEALETMGYKCIQDELLVARAYGED